MKKKGNAGSRLWAKRLTALALALLTLMSCMGTAFAEEEPKTPAAALDTYELDGLTYYNVNSPNFESPPKYLRDMMDLTSPALGYRSMAQMWLEAGVGMCFDSNSLKNGTTTPFNAGKDTAINCLINAIENGNAEEGNFQAGSSQVVYATSLYNAAQALEETIPGEMMNMPYVADYYYPYNRHNTESTNAAKKNQDVVAALCYGYQDNCLVCCEVYFTDFQAVALLPDDSGTNYVTTTLKDEKKPERRYASNVKNMTLSPVTASQNVSTSWSSSITSTVNHSFTYSFTEAFKIGAEFTFRIAKITPELSFSASQIFSDGWSKTTSETKSGTISETVSVSLPPYTNVLLEQGSSTTEAETKYNCPIGLKYKVLYNMFTIWSSDGTLNKIYQGKATFGPDARADLYQRALLNGDLDIDSDVHWPNVLAIEGMRDKITKITNHVPMSPVGAAFREKLDTTYTEVKSIAPLEPLAVVKILPPDVSIVGSQQQSYTNLNYLHADMKVGESSYTNYLKLRGENAFGAEYYGFSYRNGDWIVVKPDGTEWDDDTAPVKVEKDSATGYIRYTAVKPGTCFLKYVIDEDCYATASSDTCTKNSDLVSTAALEITVSGVKEDISPTGTITVSGNYFGFVGKEPTALDGENGLTVSIQDFSGKELEKPYYWEKKELDSRGITLNDENKVSFTKTGKYHVRAVCDEIAAKSDWYEIEVHNYTFTAEGANIMASCTDPECDDVMFTVERPKKTTYGDGKSAWASVTGKIPGMTPPTVVYWRGTEELSAPPRDAGVYAASITIGDATARVEYKIEQAEAAVTALPTASSITAGQPLSASTLTGGEADTAGSFRWKDETLRPGAADSEETEYEVIFTPKSENYKPVVCKVKLSVEAAPTEIRTAPAEKDLTYNGEEQELVTPGEAVNGRIVYAVTEEENPDPVKLEYFSAIPTAVEAGRYYVWYMTVGEDEHSDSEPHCIPVEIKKAVPEIVFPVTQLLATGKNQPLVVDPIVTPAKGVKVYYSLGDTENEIVDSPMGKERGEYAVYYRIESGTPSCESLPYGEPVYIRIQSALEEQLPNLQVSLADWTYGEAPNKPVVSGNRGYPVSYRYREMEADDEAYTETVPTDAGEYVVEAAASSEYYYGTVTATANFTIKKRTPVIEEDFVILPNVYDYDGSYRPLVDIAVKDGTTLKLWCSFDGTNVLAGTPKKRDPGTYEIWYKVSGDKNYAEMTEWNGPVLARILTPITVIVKDGAKFYDGKPMEIRYTVAGLPEDCRVEDVMYSGSITEEGVKNISVTSLRIIDAQGSDITDGFHLEYLPGRLVVLENADIVVPEMLREIEPEAFAGLEVRSVMLTESVESVDAWAFENCPQLKTFIVCGAETEIDNRALSGCDEVIVCAPDGSPAEKFADYNKFSFIPLVDQAG